MRHLFFFILALWGISAWASLDEVVISTEDKSCAIHYLTTNTKYNWSIKVDPNSCQKGWVNGYASVQLYSPQKKLMETLSGFFNSGYWLDTFPATGELIERNSPQKGTQSFSFLLGKDTEANISYIGQLRAIQPEGRSYGTFQGCPDFRILVVVPEAQVFQNKAFQEQIVKQGLTYAHQYCSQLDVLALFGATSAVQSEIIFHMQVDPATEERQIISLPKKEEKKEHILPIELRQEKTEILLSVEPKEKNMLVSYTLPSIGKEMPMPAKPPKEKNILKHLQILSKVEQRAVEGRVVVHIDKVLLDGTGITDLPEIIQLLHHPNIKPGWAIIEGALKENQMQVSRIQFCQKEWCTDVP